MLSLENNIFSPKVNKFQRRTLFRTGLIALFAVVYIVQIVYVPVLDYLASEPESLLSNGHQRRLLDVFYFGDAGSPPAPEISKVSVLNAKLEVFLEPVEDDEKISHYEAFVSTDLSIEDNSPSVNINLNMLQEGHPGELFFRFKELENNVGYRVCALSTSNVTGRGNFTCAEDVYTPQRIPSHDPSRDLMSQDMIASGGVVLYMLGIFYMFIALAIICDEFFVPALEVIAEKWNLSDDVAGATLMAAGGSAPELFTSFMSTLVYVESSLGFGTIVGSAVFNVLFVIAMCAIFTNGDLPLTWWPLARDCFYYSISLVCVALFFGTVSPCEIELWESCVMFGLYIGYVVFMAYNEKIHACLENCMLACKGAKRHDMSQLSVELEDVDGNVEALDTNTIETPVRRSTVSNNPATLASSSRQIRTGSVAPHTPYIKKEPSHFRAGIWNMMKTNKPIVDTAKLHIINRIKGDVHTTFDSLDKDGSNTITRDEIHLLLKECEGDKVSADEVDQLMKELDHDGDGLVTREEFSRWYALSEERIKRECRQIFELVDKENNGKVDLLQFRYVMTYIEPGPEPPTEGFIQDVFHALDKDNDGKVTKEEFEVWYADSELFREKVKTSEVVEDDDEEEGVSLEWPEGFQARFVYLFNAPLVYLMYYTIPNNRLPQWRNWCYFSFFMSIVHIGIYSYLMVWFATIMGDVFSIPEKIMGLTILAMGTSVPDLLSSVVVARQGKGDMAVSSSIGSNIFDVTVGLPIPWIVYSLVYQKSYKVIPDDVSIFILLAMIFFVIVFIVMSGWKLNKCLAVLMFSMYCIYVGLDIWRTSGYSPDPRCF